jgi:serine/threonine protein kinase
MSIDKIGKFHVLETLGSGAHSNILRIRRDADDREYALKIVPIEDEHDLKYLEQAKHEFRVGQMLNHPNLVKILAFETETNWLFKPKKAKLLIEYVPGETLDEADIMKPARMLRVFERIADGLTHMHKQGVIHADLKPNNLILGAGTKVKVLDFGLSWIKGEPKGRLQGTLEYMAPETASHRIVSERTEVFNFGATMYRIATLKNPPAVAQQGAGVVLNEKTFHGLLKPVDELNPMLPKGLVDLIHQCLSFKALNRPERMSQVQGILDQLADEAAAKCDPDDLG